MKVRNRSLSSLIAVLAVALLAVGMAGCGDDGGGGKTYSDEPLGQEQKVTVESDASFDEDQQAVIDTIVEFGDATADKDFAKVCDELFTETSAKLGGGQCEKRLAAAGKAFDDFSVTIKSVTVGEDGNSATVDTVTTAAGKAAPQQYSLKKNAQGEWRIAILGQ